MVEKSCKILNFPSKIKTNESKELDTAIPKRKKIVDILSGLLYRLMLLKPEPVLSINSGDQVRDLLKEQILILKKGIASNQIDIVENHDLFLCRQNGFFNLLNGIRNAEISVNICDLGIDHSELNLLKKYANFLVGIEKLRHLLTYEGYDHLEFNILEFENLFNDMKMFFQYSLPNPSLSKLGLTQEYLNNLESMYKYLRTINLLDINKNSFLGLVSSFGLNLDFNVIFLSWKKFNGLYLKLVNN